MLTEFDLEAPSGGIGGVDALGFDRFAASRYNHFLGLQSASDINHNLWNAYVTLNDVQNLLKESFRKVRVLLLAISFHFEPFPLLLV
jgi:hypothetical protein